MSEKQLEDLLENNILKMCARLYINERSAIFGKMGETITIFLTILRFAGVIDWSWMICLLPMSLGLLIMQIYRYIAISMLHESEE